MKQYFLDNNSEKLILFFCGWGMDERPFKPLKTKYNLLLLYDYSDLSLNFDFSGYKEIHLLAYSYGVFMAAMLKDILPDLKTSTAINGTLSPISNSYGVPEKVFKLTLENMTVNTAMKFRERLFNNINQLNTFNKNQPLRDIDNILFELEKLKEYFQNEINFNYDTIFIAEEDKIIPSKNQINYWTNFKKHFNVNIIPGGHFPFYNHENIEDFLKI